METTVHAQTEEAHGVAGEAPGHLPRVYESTCGASDRVDQSGPQGLGELLCGGPLSSMLRVYQRLGRKENPASSDAGTETQGLRLEAVE